MEGVPRENVLDLELQVYDPEGNGGESRRSGEPTRCKELCLVRDEEQWCIISKEDKEKEAKTGKVTKTLGRSKENDLRMNELSISRCHAQFICESIFWNDQFRVIDLGSRNGTFVNSKRLVPGEAERLVGGEEIQFGEMEGKPFRVVLYKQTQNVDNRTSDGDAQVQSAYLKCLKEKAEEREKKKAWEAYRRSIMKRERKNENQNEENESSESKRMKYIDRAEKRRKMFKDQALDPSFLSDERYALPDTVPQRQREKPAQHFANYHHYAQLVEVQTPVSARTSSEKPEGPSVPYSDVAQKMLERMGWKAGMGLGPQGSEGGTEPLSALLPTRNGCKAGIGFPTT